MDPFFSQADTLQLNRLQGGLAEVQQAVADGQVDEPTAEELRRQIVERMQPLQQRQQHAQQFNQARQLSEMEQLNQFSQVQEYNNRKFQAATLQDTQGTTYDQNMHAQTLAGLKAKYPNLPPQQLVALANAAVSEQGGARHWAQTEQGKWEAVEFPGHKQAEEHALDREQGNWHPWSGLAAGAAIGQQPISQEEQQRLEQLPRLEPRLMPRPAPGPSLGEMLGGAAFRWLTADERAEREAQAARQAEREALFAGRQRPAQNAPAQNQAAAPAAQAAAVPAAEAPVPLPELPPEPGPFPAHLTELYNREAGNMRDRSGTAVPPAREGEMPTPGLNPAWDAVAQHPDFQRWFQQSAAHETARARRAEIERYNSPEARAARAAQVNAPPVEDLRRFYDRSGNDVTEAVQAVRNSTGLIRILRGNQESYHAPGVGEVTTHRNEQQQQSQIRELQIRRLEQEHGHAEEEREFRLLSGVRQQATREAEHAYPIPTDITAVMNSATSTPGQRAAAEQQHGVILQRREALVNRTVENFRAALPSNRRREQNLPAYDPARPETMTNAQRDFEEEAARSEQRIGQMPQGQQAAARQAINRMREIFRRARSRQNMTDPEKAEMERLNRIVPNANPIGGAFRAMHQQLGVR